MTGKTLLAKCLRRGLLPLLPDRWRLCFTLWLHLRFEDAEPELIHLAKLVPNPKQGVAIDAGANIGLYALSLARLFEKVYAFEIDENTSRDLKSCACPNVEIINVGLSNRAGEATLYNPIQPNGTILDGWASLQRDNCPGSDSYIETVVKIKPLDGFAIQECDFIKIDVEGREVELLEGALKTLRRTRPVILVEIRKHNAGRVSTLLEPLGYRQVSLMDIVGIEAIMKMQSLCHIFSLAARMRWSEAKIHAYEPNPVMWSFLQV